MRFILKVLPLPSKQILLMVQEKILITGALGQIGTELTQKLRSIFGKENVIATDVKENFQNLDFYYQLDVLDFAKLQQILKKEKITTVYHLAALLSATAEKHPAFGWDLNTKSLIQILELAKKGIIQKIFWPSSIAVFGPDTPKEFAPQNAIKNPSTLYGIAKVAGEQWCKYYHQNFGVDVRSIRYPGLISWKTKAGGGTTDYAVEIFYDAIEKQSYHCFLAENTSLPMLYMEDAVEATMQLMQINSNKISIRTSYNLGGLSFSPKELAIAIKEEIKDFHIVYQPDFRQDIANSWPNSIDDSAAKNDWNWEPKYNLSAMTKEMLGKLQIKLNKNIVTSI